MYERELWGVDNFKKITYLQIVQPNSIEKVVDYVKFQLLCHGPN